MAALAGTFVQYPTVQVPYRTVRYRTVYKGTVQDHNVPYRTVRVPYRYRTVWYLYGFSALPVVALRITGVAVLYRTVPVPL